MTNHFRKAKEDGVQWQLNRSYSLSCTPGHVAAQFNRHGNFATAAVDTVVLGKFQAACVSKITVELTTFLPCSLMSEMEYNGECCRRFMACDVKRSCSMESMGVPPPWTSPVLVRTSWVLSHSDWPAGL